MTDKSKSTKSKKRYKKPELKHIGYVNELTTGGTMASPEQGPKDVIPDKRI